MIRKRKGLSQAELAAQAGMGEGTYQKYESGAVDIKLKRYHQIIDALGVSELVQTIVREWRKESERGQKYGAR